MKGMTFTEARDIVRRDRLSTTDHRIIREAWQFLIDRHHIRRMDDWFQKTAQELIDLKILLARPPGRKASAPAIIRKRNELATVLTNLRVYSAMTYCPARGSNSVGQSSVLIKRRSRVQVPPAPPISRREI